MQMCDEQPKHETERKRKRIENKTVIQKLNHIKQRNYSFFPQLLSGAEVIGGRKNT